MITYETLWGYKKWSDESVQLWCQKGQRPERMTPDARWEGKLLMQVTDGDLSSAQVWIDYLLPRVQSSDKKRPWHLHPTTCHERWACCCCPQEFSPLASIISEWIIYIRYASNSLHFIFSLTLKFLIALQMDWSLLDGWIGHLYFVFHWHWAKKTWRGWRDKSNSCVCALEINSWIYGWLTWIEVGVRCILCLFKRKPRKEHPRSSKNERDAKFNGVRAISTAWRRKERDRDKRKEWRTFEKSCAVERTAKNILTSWKEVTPASLSCACACACAFIINLIWVESQWPE